MDQVTDVHNGAAILRTASFFGVDCVLVAMKGNFGRSPTFSRIASGSIEHVKIIKVASLPKTLNKLKDKKVLCIGLSEHAGAELEPINYDYSTCLVLGAEDVGLSNAVSRVLDKNVSLRARGEIKSLNVSVASAIAMEKIWGA